MMQVEGSSEKKRTRTSSELEEEIHKDFSIFELFKTNNIEEVAFISLPFI